MFIIGGRMNSSSTPTPNKDQDMANKWVYLFHEGNSEMRDLLGGKGAGLSEMTNAGLPVPAGFTITTEACNTYNEQDFTFPNGLWEQVQNALRFIETESGKTFGDAQNPLLVSVRSGAKFSMPGMMDTILNLGLNQETVRGLSDSTGNPQFAFDSYRRFIQMFSKVVLGLDANEFEKILTEKKRAGAAIQDADLTAEVLEQICHDFKALVLEQTGKPFEEDPQKQLAESIKAVFHSWNNQRAFDYRNYNNIPHDLGTAVNIVSMVFGNMGDDCGTGVAFTRNPATGDNELYGEFLTNAQGEDVVAGIRTPESISALERSLPKIYQQFLEVGKRLETNYRDAQDLEFTVERGTLYMLQTRSAKRTARAAVKIAVDMVSEGLITKEEALQRVEPQQIEQLLLPRFDETAKENAERDGNLLTSGLNASPGAASGKVVFSADKAQALKEKIGNIILVRPETSPDDVHGMLVSKGILTALGGATSHAAVVARGLGLPCVVGAGSLDVNESEGYFSVNGVTIRENEEISIDGTTGQVFRGLINTIDPDIEQEQELQTLLSWADETRRLGVWVNADTPQDAERGLSLGAEGIGLCRTEHMFFAEERLPIMRKMILAAANATELEEAHATLKHQVDTNSARESQEVATAKLKDLERQIRTSPAVASYHESLNQLLEFQSQDFRDILKVMSGKPVIIRLLDPPLHEFLPNYEGLLEQVIELRIKQNDPETLAESEKLLDAVNSMREVNPMLGLRGCRLGLMYSAINAMQVTAIFTAACDLVSQGIEVLPEVMIPLVGHVNELKIVRGDLEAIATHIQNERKIKVNYKFGTMIEVPRAALTAGEIAQYADFFSFGTNDLTQTTFGYSRDDAESKFLLKYVERGILPKNPFQTLDTDGVGKLMQGAVELGLQTQPSLEIGICGEHGGDPDSVAFCHTLGLNYVSCSPFRVPIARLAAAQAAIEGTLERDR